MTEEELTTRLGVDLAGLAVLADQSERLAARSHQRNGGRMLIPARDVIVLARAAQVLAAAAVEVARGAAVAPTGEDRAVASGASGYLEPNRLLIKAAPDRDLYVGWSMVADGPTWVGTRAQALAALRCSWREATATNRDVTPEDRLARVDQAGTTSLVGDGTWGDDGMVVGGYAWLPRRWLGDYALAGMAETGDAERYLWTARNAEGDLTDPPDDWDPTAGGEA